MGFGCCAGEGGGLNVILMLQWAEFAAERVSEVFACVLSSA